MSKPLAQKATGAISGIFQYFCFNFSESTELKLDQYLHSEGLRIMDGRVMTWNRKLGPGVADNLTKAAAVLLG